MNISNQIDEILTAKHLTLDRVQAGDSSKIIPEWGRWRDVQRLFGIKRGTLYNLMAEGKVKSVVLRRKGNVHGCRLFHLASVSEYLNSLLEQQNPDDGKDLAGDE